MTLTEKAKSDLRTLVALYAAATRRGTSGICNDAIGNASFYKRNLEGDSAFSTTTFDNFVAWLSANWPNDPNYPWPPSIERPAVIETARR